MIRRALSLTAALACSLALAGASLAGTYRTITIDNDYTDWSGVPVLNSDGGDNTVGPDIGDIQIANDLDNLYIHTTFPNGVSFQSFVTVDVDENVATGYDIFGMGLVGGESSWQNDFPFTQSTGVFNDAIGMNGDYFTSGAALMSPFVNSTDRELAFSLDVRRNGSNAAVFPDDTIRLLIWTDGGSGDVSAVINYTLAPVPEPAAISLAVVAAIGGLLCRRR